MNLNTEQKFVVGIKQTLKAISQQSVITCYIAKDANQSILENIIEKCKEYSIPISYFDTMKELGKKFKISVGAASAAELK